MSPPVLSIGHLAARRDILNLLMKAKFKMIMALAGALAVCRFPSLAAQQTNSGPVRVGVYDSRAVAYAWFGTTNHQHRLDEQIQAARAARAKGDTEQSKKLALMLKEQQAEIHRQVFSTAPATDALAAIRERIPGIEKQAGVTVLISKWDEQALKPYPAVQQVDVTGDLVREFKPTEKQLKVIADLQKKKPLSLEKCNELIRKGAI